MVDETYNDYQCLCPFHHNSDTPAFNVSKIYGYGVCFNPSCSIGMGGAAGSLTLEKMIMRIKGCTKIAAKRLITKNSSFEDFAQAFDSINVDEIKHTSFPPGLDDRLHNKFMSTPEARSYIKGRGLSRDTAEYFKIGFAEKRFTDNVSRPWDMIVVPAYDQKGTHIGMVGRSIEGKHFKNFGPDKGGKGFHKSQMAWNLHNAKGHDTVVITEATFDAMRVHQAGYPNVIALLGGSLSRVQEELIRRYFRSVIIMTDNESDEDATYHVDCRPCLNKGFKVCQGHKAGRELGMKIAGRLSDLRVSWAFYDERNVYARGVKDACAMTDDEANTCVRNAISHYEYLDLVS